jgi:hypothetical protein
MSVPNVCAGGLGPSGINPHRPLAQHTTLFLRIFLSGPQLLGKHYEREIFL